MQEKNVNHGRAAILGLQHLLAMYSGAVAVPLLIGTALRFNSEQMTYLVSIDIFMCGLATFIQLARNKYFGIGLPVVLGCAIQAVEPLKMIGKPIALQNIGGGDATTADFGNWKNLVTGFVTILIILIIQIWGKGFLSSIAVLIGLILGTLLAATMGMVSLQPIVEAAWFHVPQPFYFGAPHFEWSSSVTMIIISLVSMVESTGVFFALGNLLNKDITEDDLKHGYRAEGLAVVLGGIFNTFPYTTFSQNVGLLQLTGIKTKRPIYWSAVLLMILGLLPKIGALATIIPTPVLGGAMLVMFAMISVQGIRMLIDVDFKDERNILIVAVSIGLGLGVSIYPTIFQNLPRTIQLFLGNGIVVASICSVGLNVCFKGKEGLDQEQITQKDERPMTVETK